MVWKLAFHVGPYQLIIMHYATIIAETPTHSFSTVNLNFHA